VHLHRLTHRFVRVSHSETTKYLYLLFDEDNFVHNRPFIFRRVHPCTPRCHAFTDSIPRSTKLIVIRFGLLCSTEAHPFDISLVRAYHRNATQVQACSALGVATETREYTTPHSFLPQTPSAGSETRKYEYEGDFEWARLFI
jgi:hypothetical protein